MYTLCYVVCCVVWCSVVWCDAMLCWGVCIVEKVRDCVISYNRMCVPV